MAISGSESQASSAAAAAAATATTTAKIGSQSQVVVEVESVKCDSCGFTEECTPAYIARLRQRYNGRWLCGLCAEAVKDEVAKSQQKFVPITVEEALNRHIDFCREFRSSPANEGKTEHPIFVMGRILRRNLDSPRALRSNSSGSLAAPAARARASSSALVRSESCFSSISG